MQSSISRTSNLKVTRKQPRTGHTESEIDLVALLVYALHDEGYRVRREVPNMGQSADVVATRSRWVTVIEVKVRDWRRALEQCLAHEQVADFVCIAVGTGRIASELLRTAQTRGYGIIQCTVSTRSCRWILRPERNCHVWRPQRTRFAAALKVIRHER